MMVDGTPPGKNFHAGSENGIVLKGLQKIGRRLAAFLSFWDDLPDIPFNQTWLAGKPEDNMGKLVFLCRIGHGKFCVGDFNHGHV
jgi:hypothetical protein